MKKILLVLCVVAFAMLSLPTYALTLVEKDNGYVSISTTETKEVKPDTATISFAVETTDVNSKKAVEKNNQISNAMISSIKPLLSLEKKDTIQTVNYQLNPNYRVDKNGKSLLDNFTVINTIKIKTKNIENISSIIDVAVKNNVTNVDDIYFSCDDLDVYKSDLTKSALLKVKQMADATVSSLNEKVTGIKSLRVNSYQRTSNDRVMFKSLAASNAVGATTPIETGKVSISVTVDAEFYVKGK